MPGRRRIVALTPMANDSEVGRSSHITLVEANGGPSVLGVVGLGGVPTRQIFIPWAVDLLSQFVDDCANMLGGIDALSEKAAILPSQRNPIQELLRRVAIAQ